MILDLNIMHTYTCLLASAQHTKDLGQKIAQQRAKTKALILLSGDLGAGKTTFTQGFLSELMPHGAVTSPTYSYLNIYETSPPIFHFDLYRINSQEELEELGLWEHLLDDQATRLVEWPEHASGLEKYADMHVHFMITNNIRQAHITSFKSLEGIT